MHCFISTRKKNVPLYHNKLSVVWQLNNLKTENENENEENVFLLTRRFRSFPVFHVSPFLSNCLFLRSRYYLAPSEATFSPLWTIRACEGMFFFSSLVFISWDWKTKEDREVRQREGGKGWRAKKVKWKARAEQTWFHGATRTPGAVLVNWKPLSTHMADCKQRASFYFFLFFLVISRVPISNLCDHVCILNTSHLLVFAQKWKIGLIVKKASWSWNWVILSYLPV